MMNLIIYNPNIEITCRYNSDNPREENYLAMLRAASVCTGKKLEEKGADYFNQWFKTNITDKPEEQRHYSVLEHGIYSFRAVGEDKICCGNARSYIESTGFKDSCIKEFFPDHISFEIVGELSKQYYQILITTNRFTAMQLVRHRSISWLVESTRMVEYNEPTINTSEDLDPDLENSILYGFESYNKLRVDGVKREQAGRILSDYRETRLIGCATKEDWLLMCGKRMFPGAQADVRRICSTIKKEVEK